MSDPGQTSASIRNFQLAGGEYGVLTRPSYPYWDEISPASILAAQYIDITPGDKILLIGGEQGALALSFAQRSDPGEVWVMEDNTHAMQMIASSLERQGLSHGRVHDRIELPPNTDGSFDRVVILARRGRSLARRQLRIAHQALKPGGILAMAGEKRAGIQTFLKDAGDLFGAVSILGYKKGHRIGACLKNHQDARNPEWLTLEIIRRHGRHKFALELLGEQHELVSVPGVFSYDHLDEGTALLLEHSGDMSGKRVLDLGCGYGVLGLQAALSGAAHVDLVDISLAALTCARENLESLGILKGCVLSAPSFEDENPEQYDLVLMNPPFHSGKEVNYNLPAHLIQRAHRALHRGGRLTLVANRFIRYERQMGEIFRRAEIIAHTGKFHIIRGTK